jgi:DNA-binding LacI/PurR family transcriptional regulator
MVTLSEIAKRANVSKATVSLVLNDKAGVGQEKRKEIRKLIEETGYEIRNRKPQGLMRNNNIRFIKYREQGYMVNQNGDFISRIIDGIEHTARKNHFALAITNVSNKNIEEMIPIINEENDVGIIFLATEFDAENAGLLDRFKAPLVVLDNEMKFQNRNVVVMDNEYAVYLAVKYLYDMGHRRIGHITTEGNVNNLCIRTRLFRQMLQRFGLTFHEKYDYLLSADINAYCPSLLSQLDKDDLPTAIMADNDIMAINSLLAFEKLGKRVPADVSVIGIDDITISTITRPELTTIRLEKRRMGKLAVLRIMQMIKDREDTPMKIFTGAELIERKSVAPYFL